MRRLASLAIALLLATGISLSPVGARQAHACGSFTGLDSATRSDRVFDYYYYQYTYVDFTLILQGDYCGNYRLYSNVRIEDGLATSTAVVASDRLWLTLVAYPPGNCVMASDTGIYNVSSVTNISQTVHINAYPPNNLQLDTQNYYSLYDNCPYGSAGYDSYFQSNYLSPSTVSEILAFTDSICWWNPLTTGC